MHIALSQPVLLSSNSKLFYSFLRWYIFLSLNICFLCCTVNKICLWAFQIIVFCFCLYFKEHPNLGINIQKNLFCLVPKPNKDEFLRHFMWKETQFPLSKYLLSAKRGEKNINFFFFSILTERNLWQKRWQNRMILEREFAVGRPLLHAAPTQVEGKAKKSIKIFFSITCTLKVKDTYIANNQEQQQDLRPKKQKREKQNENFKPNLQFLHIHWTLYFREVRPKIYLVLDLWKEWI